MENTKTRVAIVSGTETHGYDGDQYSIPFHISEWEEVDLEDVHGIRIGLDKMSRQYVNGRRVIYSLIELPFDQKALILKSLEHYDKIRKEEEAKNAKYQKEREKRERLNDLDKRIRTLKRTLKSLSGKEAIAAVEAEIEQLKKEKSK